MTDRSREAPPAKAVEDGAEGAAAKPRGDGKAGERKGNKKRRKGAKPSGAKASAKASDAKKESASKRAPADEAGSDEASSDEAKAPAKDDVGSAVAAPKKAKADDGDAADGAESPDDAAASEPEAVEAGGVAESEPPAAKAEPIVLQLFGRTDVGQIREHNEDNFLVADLTSKQRGLGSSSKSLEVKRGGLLLAVCDGMGGAAAGEVASQMAADVIYERMLARSGHAERDKLALDIVAALEYAGTRILQEATANRACRGMGTTATVAALVDGYLLLGQVGDSRAYLLRGDRLVQVTRDQSLVNQLIEAGQLTEEEAENFEHSNIILQALGTAEAVQVDLTFAELRRGDVLMMCSDGLSGMIRDSEIAETLTNVPDPVEACRVLIDDANQAGGHDNITVIVAVFDGEGLEEATLEDVESLKYQKYAVPTWLDGRAGAASSFDDEDTYDDTPSIEITGEFEVDPNTDWADVLDDRPRIPKQEGPDLTSVMMWVGLVALVLLAYFLFFAP